MSRAGTLYRSGVVRIVASAVGGVAISVASGLTHRRHEVPEATGAPAG